MNQMEKHVERILEQMQSPVDEREEMREELLSHLQDAKISFMNDGFSEKQAEKKVLMEFGESDKIGRELQESMYPFQRGLLYLVGIATILFGVIFYINTVFFLRDFIPAWWLAIQLLSGSAVTLAAINISRFGHYFYLLNVVVIGNTIWNGINLAIAQTASMGQTLFFSFYLIILIAAALLFVFRNSYYSTPQTESKRKNKGLVQFGYILNLIFGIAITCAGLFFMWGLLVFTGVSMLVILSALPILAWLIFYKFQMGYIARKPALSLATGLLFSGLAVILPFAFLFLFSGRF